MKKFYLYIFIAASLTTVLGCKKWLDVNANPVVPQFPNVSSVFPTQIAAYPRGLQWDGRFASRYVQNFGSFTTNATNVNWDRMGYSSASDNNGDIWRQAYIGFGRNLKYIIETGIKNQQWDYVGAALAMQAAIYQYTADYHGDIIFSEAFSDNQTTFKFDDQETVYRGIDSICRAAINYLSNKNYNPTQDRLAKGDYVYNGDVDKWIKYTYGILACNFHRTTNKSSYNADSVIYYCDKSLSTNNDDFLVAFDATRNDDANFWGTYRNNLADHRQTNFIVRLLDGTTLAGVPASAATAYNRDPRLRHMLSASHDTTNGNGGYRGVDPGIGDPFNALNPWYTYAVGSTNYTNARRKVASPWGDTTYANPSASVFSTSYQKYLFGNKAVMPVMTASQIQFTKAEAAFKKGDKSTAYTAYLNGINLHFDFINRSSFPRGNTPIYSTNPISAADRSAYLVGNNVKQNAGSLTLSDIMLQKYIALWGWGFFETWVDLRRYHYLDLDAETGVQVYKGFALPATLAPENNGKPVYRVRPRYNSEYIWNIEELRRLGGLNPDYHTYETWFSQP
ncbi:SusD/RagB family nutrient-binding outer membrane lipoprotein [Niabella sp. 22666]|uniref:SusD/RagB family nutrient-binding outer membrane lipoprotein n=1 Tax=Niabella sp. 22666 TaxID=3453954 RepID=UPI003F877BCE